jgi:hypothetical protein
MNGRPYDGMEVAEALQTALNVVPLVLRKHPQIARGCNGSDFSFIREVAVAKLFVNCVEIKGHTIDEVLPYLEKWAREHDLDSRIRPEALIVATLYGLASYRIDAKGKFRST